ncbi:Pyoverdine biosynthesis [Plesiocystis pacifica SIR-1]|uniref:Pyoverdine biosynthesis n=1 Tax=Plesiocystis pacifica SIR-1 TaxID=391625 RepID=A6G9Y6_9BACT|nr:L-tyrosine/L-tryptophan isonitrile synthase family protein [Plesiocystis pacifica]EDM77311.1 Pyoverdine biosynthesis [Plesiocystis pacifica SIR-1]
MDVDIIPAGEARQAPPAHSEWTELSEISELSELSERAELLELSELIMAEGRRRFLPSGEVLWYQSDEAHELAWIAAGTLEVQINGRRVNAVGPSELIGEVSVFGALQTRSATLRALGDVEVWIISRTQLSSLRAKNPEIYDCILDEALRALVGRVRGVSLRLARLGEGTEPRAQDEPVNIFREGGGFPGEHHAKQIALRTMPVLEELDAALIERLAERFGSHVFDDGEVIFRQGERSHGIFLLANGRVRAALDIGTEAAMPVAPIQRGRPFGLPATLLELERPETVVADGPCWLLHLSPEAHEGLGGEIGRAWREALLAAARAELEDRNRNQIELEQRRAAKLAKAPGRAGVRRPTFQVLTSDERESVRETVDAIMDKLAPHRRLLPDAGACALHHCDECFGLHRAKLERCVVEGRPVHMILPAYPAKSPNAVTKVLGELPDMAEEQSLLYLQRVCDDVASVYEGGAQITLCSDGRVFSDLVLVTDEQVTAYGVEIEAMIERLRLRSIDVFAIEELFEVSSYDGMRDHLAVHYGEAIEALRDRSRMHPHMRSMYNGIHRFLFEDTVKVETGKSRSKIRKECSTRAYGVIQRSNAFSRLIAECFPDALRLSIHPQPPHSAKIGILLGTATDAWITPWHGVAVLDRDGYHLMKRSEAEAMGAVMVERRGRPSHYEVRDAG